MEPIRKIGLTLVGGTDLRLRKAAEDMPPQYALSVAINGLRDTWERHQGGKMAPEDHDAVLFAHFICRRLLSEGAPVQLGRICSGGELHR